MARRPAPILVVPKPGVTVRLHGVVVPALGLETTVDDEVANELLEGTLDDYPVPYHLESSAAPALPSLVGVAAGSMRIGGSAGSSGSQALTAPPSTLPATPAFMLSGAGFSFTFTQTSGSLTSQKVLLSFNDLADSIQIISGGLWLRAGSTTLALPGATWSLGQPVTITVRPAVGTLTIAGATTGNGTFATSGAWTWPAGVLGIGRQSLNNSGTLEFPGTLSTVTGEGGGASLAGLAGAGAGNVGVPVAVSGTAAGAQGGLVGLAGGSAGAAIAGTAAGTRVGLTGAAAGAMRIAGTGAGAQSGLTGAGTSVSSIGGTAAGAQSGLTGASSGAHRLAGSASGGYLDLTGRQPPSTYPTTPAFMLTGSFRFTFTQTSGTPATQQALFSFDESAESIQISSLGSIRIRSDSSGFNTLVSMTHTLGQPVTLTVSPQAGTLTIAGASAGNGTFSIGTWAWPSVGVLGIGRQSGSAGVIDFAGTISNVVGSGGGAIQSGLTGAATVLPDPGVGNALLIDSAGNYLVNAAGDYLYGRQ